MSFHNILALFTILHISNALIPDIDHKSPRVEKDADAGRGLHGAPVGDFDVFVLAKSWTNQFCCESSAQYCNIIPGSFASRNLALHGLWPQFDAQRSAATGYHWPEYCPPCPSDSACPVDNDVKERFFNEWRQWAPAFSDSTLDDHEWAKHGSCTGWTQARYFEESLELMRTDVTPPVIANNIGGNVTIEAIQNAYGGADWVGLACSSPSNYFPLPIIKDVFLCYSVTSNGGVGPRVPCSTTDILKEPYTNSCVTRGFRNVHISGSGECPLNNPTCPQGEDAFGCCRKECSANNDCSSEPRCLRCAGSGRCTGVPLWLKHLYPDV